jgi:hypothetical protein
MNGDAECEEGIIGGGTSSSEYRDVDCGEQTRVCQPCVGARGERESKKEKEGVRMRERERESMKSK